MVYPGYHGSTGTLGTRGTQGTCTTLVPWVHLAHIGYTTVAHRTAAEPRSSSLLGIRAFVITGRTCSPSSSSSLAD